MSQSNGVAVELAVPNRMSWENWCERVYKARAMKDQWGFYIGDLVLYGEDHFGEKASQMFEEFGYTEKQLNEYRRIARKFPPEDRRAVPWSHHQSVFRMPKKERLKALDDAAAGLLSRNALRLLAKNGNGHVEQARTISPLADALVLVGKLLVREDQGENVTELLSPALDELIAESIQKKAKIDEKLGRRI